MTTPSQVTVTSAVQGLDIDLAKLGGVDMSSERTLLTLVGSVATLVPGVAGQWLSIPGNVSLVAYIAFGLIVGAHLIGKSLHHAAVEKANGGVKEALIAAAVAASTPVQVDSPADASGSTGVAVESAVSTSSDTAPTVASNVASVGGDLPVVSAVDASASASKPAT